MCSWRSTSFSLICRAASDTSSPAMPRRSVWKSACWFAQISRATFSKSRMLVFGQMKTLIRTMTSDPIQVWVIRSITI